MNRNAFEDVHCPFNLRAELNDARTALYIVVGRYISQNPATGYRELAKQFHMSPAMLCAIAKKYSSKRKPGPRSRGTRVVFRVRYSIRGEELETAAAVTARKGISVREMRKRVAKYFKTDDVFVVSALKTERPAEYAYDELEVFASPNEQPPDATGMEKELQTLAGCIERGLGSNSGMRAFKKVTRWLAAPRMQEDDLQRRAQKMAAQYAKLGGL
jgi:hypothetical protein